MRRLGTNYRSTDGNAAGRKSALAQPECKLVDVRVQVYFRYESYC